MIKLRHIKATSLKELEAIVEAMVSPITIIGQPQNVGTNWYLHYTLALEEKPLSAKVVNAEPTKTKKVKS